jgi:hypothetical protein
VCWLHAFILIEPIGFPLRWKKNPVVMKKIVIPMALTLLALTGCVGGRVIPMGDDTYTVERRGEIYSTKFSLEAECLKDANKYCQKHKLHMTVLEANGSDPTAMVHMGSCQLVFKAVPTNSVTTAKP